MFELAILIGWVLSSLCIGCYAKNYKQYANGNIDVSIFAWFLLCIFVSPLIGAILAAGLRNKE